MELSNGNTIMRNTFFLYFRMILIMLISLYTVRIVLKILGVADYGIYNAVGGVVTSMTFITTVLSNSSQRFFAVTMAKDADNKINIVFYSIFAVYIIISFLIILAVEIGGVWLITNKLTIPVDRQSVSSMILHVSLATFIVNVLSSPFRALIIVNERMDIYAYVSIYEALGKLLVVFLLFYSDIDKLLAYVLLLLFIALTTNLIYVVFAIRKFKLILPKHINLAIVKEVTGYSSWTLFGTVAGAANIQGNSILLNIFVGPVANTAFAIANQVCSSVQQMSSSFYTAVAPPLTKSYSVGNMDYMKSLFWFSSKAVFFLSFIILFPIFIQTEYILSLWLGEVTPYTVNFVRIMLVYSLILTLGNPITTIVQAAGQVKLYHTLVDGFSLLVFPFSYIILKLGYKPEFILISMVLIFFVSHLLRLFVLSRTITFSICQYIIRIIIPCFIIISICGFFVYFTGLYKNSDNYIISLLYMVVSVILSSVLTFLLLFNKEERYRLNVYTRLRGVENTRNSH